MDRASVRVAIVDDDPSVRRALERLLRASGYEPSTYEAGGAFLASVGSPGAGMPGRGLPDAGHDRARTPPATWSRRASRIPTIVITAHDAADLRQRCMAAGIAAYLPKPLERDVVISAIVRAIRQAAEP